MNVQRATVTPEIAAEWLRKSGTKNRNLKRGVVAGLARAMRGGEWRVNGETIIKDDAGNILDGHHRLSACVEAGVPFETLIVFGAPADALATIDTGRARTAADTLTFAGEVNADTLSAAARLTWLAHEGCLEFGSRSGGELGLTREALVAFVRAHPGLRESASRASTRYKLFPHLPRSVWGFLDYYLPELSAGRARAFLSALESGAGLESGDPRHVLRERLILNAASKAKLPLVQVLALTAKAWNLYLAGRTVKFLRWRTEGDSPEPFPKFDKEAEL